MSPLYAPGTFDFDLKSYPTISTGDAGHIREPFTDLQCEFTHSQLVPFPDYSTSNPGMRPEV